MSSTDQQPSAHVDHDDASKVPSEQIHTATAGSKSTQEPFDISTLNLQPASLALHADDKLNQHLTDVSPPIHLSTTYRYLSDPSKLVPFDERPAQGRPFRDLTEHIYSRDSSSNNTRFETILASLLKGPVLTYSSGLAAFNAILVHLTPKKVVIGAGYHGSHGVLELYKRLTGAQILDLTTFKAEDLDAGDLIWLETPVNPTGEAFDIVHYAGIAHSRGAYLGVDSTFAPPPLQDPFVHGADVIMHSGTKYIGGHSDLLCGVVVIRPDGIQQKGEGEGDGEGDGEKKVTAASIVAKMTTDRLFLGSVMGNLENWLGIRSLRTLELRVSRQSESADRIVSALDGALTGATVGTGLSQSDVQIIQKTVSRLHHASLQTADYKQGWLKKQMPNGYGPVFSIVMKKDELARRLPSKLHLFHHATSLGGVESLIEWRRMTDDSVGRDLLRVSIGVEDYRDLLDDLLQGFRKVAEEVL